MSGLYLLDSNALRAWVDARDPRHEPLREGLEQVPEQYVQLSVVTVAELHYGLALPHKVDPGTVRALRAATGRFLVRAIDRHVTETYGRLRARLFERFAPRKKRRKRSVSQLVDPATDESLGIQENDLWIASQAITVDAELVTYDKTTRIREVARELDTPLRATSW
ncbi:MAG: type II toxin-antitoxin system VapC family toxin [Myxococcota bacterium]